MKFYRSLLGASLNRIVPEHDKQRLFQTFYSTFIHMSPETERYFSQRSDEESRQIIFKSSSAILTADGDLFVSDLLEQLARGQSKEGPRLPPWFLAFWQEATLKIIHTSDPLCDEEILIIWAMAVAPGLEYLRRQAELRYQTVDQ